LAQVQITWGTAAGVIICGINVTKATVIHPHVKVTS